MDVFGALAKQGAMIDRIVSDSRRVAPGAAFLAYPGEAADGRRHIADAIARGGAAVVWESDGFEWDRAWKVPNVGVRELKQHAGALAHEFFGRPSEALWVCGVTGTNGKTSCSQWIAAALSARGEECGVIGTIGARLRDTSVDVGNTTPDALELHRLLAEFLQEGAKAVAMEVSSHGLVQGRVNGVQFDCALFTNLTHDHLDFHGTMEAYAAAKAQLFEFASLESAVVNLDDPVGVKLAKRLKERGVPTTGYSLSLEGLEEGSVARFIAARGIEVGSDVTRVDLATSWGDRQVTLPQLGRFNVSNILGVLGCLLAHGQDMDSALASISTLPDVPGRMQRLGGSGRPIAVVDYAHTPDALEKALAALRPIAEAAGGELIAVFGAGGNRDPTKRPRMGEIASRLADRVVITSDNPRNEDPAMIIEAIRAGVSIGHDVEPDRAKAIAAAIRNAKASDVVLIAGKGHETYQEIAGKRHPFSDVVVAEQSIAAWSQR